MRKWGEVYCKTGGSVLVKKPETLVNTGLFRILTPRNYLVI